MRFNRLVWFSTLLVSLASLTAKAEERADTEALKATLEQNLLRPLASRDSRRSRFSRGEQPPVERRVRVADQALKQDARGQSYATFTLEERYDKWYPIAGCIYPGDGSIYLRLGDDGDAYRSATWLLGKKAETPPATVCRPAAGR